MIAELYESARLKPSMLWQIRLAGQHILHYRHQYEPVAERAGIPWWTLGLIHMREASGDFNLRIKDGSPLRGSESWSDSALATIKPRNKHGLTVSGDVEAEGQFCEEWNGLGYRARGINSPYLWSGTQHYLEGKYVRDGEFNSSFVDKQPGVMAVRKWLETEGHLAPGGSAKPFRPELKPADPKPSGGVLGTAAGSANSPNGTDAVDMTASMGKFPGPWDTPHPFRSQLAGYIKAAQETTTVGHINYGKPVTAVLPVTSAQNLRVWYPAYIWMAEDVMAQRLKDAGYAPWSGMAYKTGETQRLRQWYQSLDWGPAAGLAPVRGITIEVFEDEPKKPA